VRRIVFLMAMCLFAPTLVGCGGSSKNITAWQRGVERYIADHGRDPVVLRDVTLEDNRPGFAVLGGLDPNKSTDARALLLGHKIIADRPWFIYLVGIVAKQKVQEIRLAALSASGSQTIWRLGPRDNHALKLYRDAGWSDWKAHGGGTSKPPPQYTTFPRESDVFELTIDGTKITATQKPSGAQWTDDIASPPGKH
jgi:hypothetical protein